jgi:hypothetical protein
MLAAARPVVPTEPAQVHRLDFALPPRAARLHARAAAARTGGVTLIVGALTLAAAGLMESSATPAVLPVAWVLALALAWSAGRAAARAIIPLDDSAAARARAWLFAGLALIGPLSLHAIVQPNLWAPGPYHTFSDGDPSFTHWVLSSVMLTGLSHLTFAALCAWRGRVGRARGPRLVAIALISAAMALPCMIFYSVFGLLPVLYVAVTAAPVLWLLSRLERTLDPRAT